MTSRRSSHQGPRGAGSSSQARARERDGSKGNGDGGSGLGALAVGLAEAQTTDAVGQWFSAFAVAHGFESVASLALPRTPFETARITGRLDISRGDCGLNSVWTSIIEGHHWQETAWFVQLDRGHAVGLFVDARNVASRGHATDGPEEVGVDSEFSATARRCGVGAILMLPVLASLHLLHVVTLGAPPHAVRSVETAVLMAGASAAFARWQVVESSNVSGRFNLRERETEVTRWIAEGKTDWEIGQILGIGAKTVNFHAENVKRKCGVATRVQAVIRVLTDVHPSPSASDAA